MRKEQEKLNQARNKMGVSVITPNNPNNGLLEEVKKELLKEGRATFAVCCLDFEGEYYLIEHSVRFDVANRIGVPITLVEYDYDDFIPIESVGFAAEDFQKFIDDNGSFRIGDLFDNFMWNGPTYELEAYVIEGNPIYSLTEKQREMKCCALSETGVDIVKAYKELGMNEDSDLEIYRKYYINKLAKNA
jgi:hypothetical protein